MSSWAQPSCHSQKTKFASGPSWPLATTLFGPPLPGWPLSLGRRGVIEMSYLWLSTTQAPVLCTWTSQSHAVLHICLLQKGHGNVFLGESEFTRHWGGNAILPRSTQQTEKLNTLATVERHMAVSLPSHYRPQSALPSQNLDLLHRQRKWFLHVPKGQVIPNAAANLATNSLRKDVFSRRKKKNRPFTSLLRFFNFGGLVFFFSS